MNKLKKFINLLNDKKNEFIKELSFKKKISKKLIQKIDFENINNCPIMNQFFPKKIENKKEKGFGLDPTCDSQFRQKNLLKKYTNRALLICSDKCFAHCRFCFRKNFSYKIIDFSFEEELDLIRKDKSLNEIILSGGDPLILENDTLKNILEQLNEINHIKRIRFHTKCFSTNPIRINKEFLKILKSIKKQIIFVAHVNHKNEIDTEFLSSSSKIQKLKIPILSQTVLLKNINDDPYILCELFECLSNSGIIPYYLHQLDQVYGTSHFKVPISKGKKIINKLRELTSGYNIPKYVYEVPHKKSKTLIL